MSHTSYIDPFGPKEIRQVPEMIKHYRIIVLLTTLGEVCLAVFNQEYI